MFAHNLNRIMQEKGFTCTMLVKAGGFSKGAVSSWTSGTCIPKAENIEAIAEALDVPAEELEIVETPKPTQDGGPEFVPRKNTLTCGEAAALLHKNVSYIPVGTGRSMPGGRRRSRGSLEPRKNSTGSVIHNT